MADDVPPPVCSRGDDDFDTVELRTSQNYGYIRRSIGESTPVISIFSFRTTHRLSSSVWGIMLSIPTFLSYIFMMKGIGEKIKGGINRTAGCKGELF